MKFNDILEAVDVLPLEDKIELQQILDKRLLEQQRNDIANEISHANNELESNSLKTQSVDDIMSELTDDL